MVCDHDTQTHNDRCQRYILCTNIGQRFNAVPVFSDNKFRMDLFVREFESAILRTKYSYMKRYSQSCQN